MKNDESYGVIPLREVNGEKQVLIIRQAAGHWGFPKGHKEPGEQNLEAARRELQEETGLKVAEFLSFDPFMENYQFEDRGQKIDKYVWYYPVYVEGVVLLDQPKEVIDAKWVNYNEAIKTLTFPQAKNFIKQLQNM